MDGTNDPFWRDAVGWRDAVTLRVLPHILIFGAYATLVWLMRYTFGLEIHVAIAPYEVVGAVLALLLVLRTNAGNERWWEARKLWGGIVNQTRNLAVAALTYGPSTREWREEVVRWTAGFPHVARHSLRGERDASEIVILLGDAAAERVTAADHMPSQVTREIARLLRVATDAGTMDRFAFIQADRERALLIDHIGGCERILKTPLPRTYSIKIRRFVLLFLLVLPFGLLSRVGDLTPFVTMLVAYPLLALDRIGEELQNPFSTDRLSHLPLSDICETIQRNLLDMLRAERVPDCDGMPLDQGWTPAAPATPVAK